MKVQKTNAMRFLDRNKISYKTHEYECKDGKIDGLAVAEKLNQNPKMVFKTLVTQGTSKEFYVFVLPVAEELDLKKAAKAAGEKKVEMIHVKDINKHTGYIRGGCSPLAMKKLFKTFFHETAKDFETIIFSGGKIGTQIEANAEEVAKSIRAEFKDLIIKK